MDLQLCWPTVAVETHNMSLTRAPFSFLVNIDPSFPDFSDLFPVLISSRDREWGWIGRGGEEGKGEASSVQFLDTRIP